MSAAVDRAWQRVERAIAAEQAAHDLAWGLAYDHDHEKSGVVRPSMARDAAVALGLWGHLICDGLTATEEWAAAYTAGVAA
jgi:hypothetical protein